MPTLTMTPEQAIKADKIQSWWEAVEVLHDIRLLDRPEYLTMREKLKQLIGRNQTDPRFTEPEGVPNHA